jgi:hypothetical protein
MSRPPPQTSPEALQNIFGAVVNSYEVAVQTTLRLIKQPEVHTDKEMRKYLGAYEILDYDGRNRIDLLKAMGTWKRGFEELERGLVSTL